MLLDAGFEQPFNKTYAAWFGARLKAKDGTQREKWAFRSFMQGFSHFFPEFKAVWPPLPPVAQNKVNGGGMVGDDLGVTHAGRPLFPR